jgi:hypothetical protein
MRESRELQKDGGEGGAKSPPNIHQRRSLKSLTQWKGTGQGDPVPAPPLGVLEASSTTPVPCFWFPAF